MSGWLSAAVLGALGLVACGEALEDGDEDGGSGGGVTPTLNGGGNEGGGGLISRQPELEGLTIQEGQTGVADVCQGAALGPQVITSHPGARGGLAAVQYAKAALASGKWPEVAALRLDDFFAYYADNLAPGEASALALRAQLTRGPGSSATFSIAARLPQQLERPPLHLVVLTDVSDSTEGSLAIRDRALSALADAIDVGGKDALSLVAYGDPPQVLLEHALAPAVRAGLDDLPADLLAPRAGGDLAGALSLVSQLQGDGPTHVVILTDGGAVFDDALAELLATSSKLGVVTSVVQLGRDVPSEAPVFYNDALLDGVARFGGGTRLFFPAAVDQGRDPFAEITSRYDELFGLVASDVSLVVTLPPGLAASVPDSGSAVPGVVGYRSVGLDLQLELACDTALTDDPLSGIGVALYPTDALEPLASEVLPLSKALTPPGIEAALPVVVRGLRSRDPVELGAAQTAIAQLEGTASCADDLDLVSCDLTTLCCAQADLRQLLATACELAGGCP